MKKYIKSEDHEDFVYVPKYKDLDEAYMNYKAVRISKYMPKKQQAELRKKKAAYKKQMEELRKKYAEEDVVTSATEISSAMQDMIDSIADEWKKDIEDQDCENFKEFCQLNDYTAADIRDEFRYMIQNHYDGWMYDDGTIVIASDDSEMPYGEFKKAVLDRLK